MLQIYPALGAPSSRLPIRRQYTIQLVVRRGNDSAKRRPPPPYFGDDLLGWLVPYEGPRVVVPVFGPQLDSFDQVRYRGEDATAQSTFGEFSEPALDEVQPGRTRRGEVKMPTGPLGVGQPIADLRRLVGAQVVQDHMDLEFFLPHGGR